MPAPIDAVAFARRARRALAYATPDVAAEFVFAQLPFLDAGGGCALAERLFAVIPEDAWVWQIEDKILDRWPAPVADLVLARAKEVPRGELRIELLCQVPRRLSLDEKRDALDGILDGTLPRGGWAGPTVYSNEELVQGLVRALPADWQEEWIAHEIELPLDPKYDREVKRIAREAEARNALGLWPESAARAVWEKVDALAPDRYKYAFWRLPPRPGQPAAPRRELTEAERVALVETPSNPYTAKTEPGMADHLRRVEEHLPRVPMAARLRWLGVVRGFVDDASRFQALIALAPFLEGADCQEAADEAVQIALREGSWRIRESWELIPAYSLAPVAEMLARKDHSGWYRDELIEHITRGRSAADADGALFPLLALLPEIRVDRRIETLTALTPWLADRTSGAFPRAIAARDLPRPAPAPDRHARLWHQLRRL